MKQVTARAAAVGAVVGLALGACVAAISGSPAQAAPPPECATVSGLVTCTYETSGTVYSLPIPTGITSVSVDVYGASGYDPHGPASLGGRAWSPIAVTPGTVLTIRVGGAGSGTAGGWNGGGWGGSNTIGLVLDGGGGGGGSDVRQGGDTLDDRVVVAGGGGGGGDVSDSSVHPGGAGGGAVGGDGSPLGGVWAGFRAGGATPTAVGHGWNDGNLGQGGNASQYGGGGGGGGWLGGGGGIGNTDPGAFGGGGGGGNATVPGGCVTPIPGAGCTAGVRSGNGKVVITYSVLAAAPTLTKTVPGNTQATLTWTAPVVPSGLPITGYVVTPYKDGTPQPAVTFNSTARTQTLTGLTNGSQYWFRVAAITADGAGAPSGEVILVRPGAPLAPGFPDTAPGNGSARVTWWAPTDFGFPITGYKVRANCGGGQEWSFPADARSATLSTVSIVNGSVCTFDIVATNQFGDGVVARTPQVIIGTPTTPGFPNPVPGNGNVRISWLAPNNNGSPVTGYAFTPVIGSTPQGTYVLSSFSGTTTTIPGLVNGTTYTFRVAATNAYGTGPYSTTVPVTIGAPAPPGFQTAQPADHGAVVQFATPPANASPLLGYTVTPYIGSTPQPTQTFNTPAATQLPVTGLTNGTTYTFRVAAFNAVGSSPTAVTAAVTAGAPGTPGYPAAAPGNGTAKVAWWAPPANGSPVTGYKITPYIGSTAQPTLTFNSTATSQTVTGLLNGTTYTFRVIALNASGSSPSGTTAAIKVGTPTVPVFPAASSGNASATITWYAPAANGSAITGYTVTPYLGSVAQPSQTFNSPATSQTISGLNNGATYTFRVTARNAIGTGPYATTAAVKIGLPAAPTNVIAVAGPHSANVSWNVANGNGSAITGYVVTPYIGTVAQAPQTFGIPIPNAMVMGLQPGVAYTFKVAAINNQGTGPQSAASNSSTPS